MPFLDSPIARHYTEKKPKLHAYYELLCRLYRYAEEELGQKIATSTINDTLQDGPFAGIPITVNGFVLTQDAKQPLDDLPNDRVKQMAYREAIEQFLSELSEHLEPAAVAEACTKFCQDITKQTGVRLPYFGKLTHAKASTSFFDRLIGFFIQSAPTKRRRVTKSTPSSLIFHGSDLRSILSYVDEGVMVVDENHKILFASQKMEGILDLPLEQIENKYLANILHLANETSTISDMTYLPNLYDTAKSIFYVGKNLKLSSFANQTKYVDLHIERLGHTTGSLPKFLLIVRPLDARGSTENQHELFSIMAHELKTPLTALRGYLAILQDDLPNTLHEEQTILLARMAISTNELLALTENLLAVNKIENNSLQMQFETADLHDLITRVTSQLIPMAQAKQVRITYDAPKQPLPMVVCDKIRFMEVLTNLINNAIKFNHIGGNVWVRVYQEKDAVRIEVSDNGPGIAQDAIPKLFNKYVQVDPAIQSHNTGAGLGLYICKEIIAAHTGQIWVHSARNQGSTFAFRIPLNLKSSIDSAATASKRTFQSRGESITLSN